MQDRQNLINIFPENCNIHIYNSDANINYENDCEIEKEIDFDIDVEELDGRGIAPEGHCTLCGKKLNEWDRQEDFSFDYHVGYGSKFDGDIIHAKLCCDCFDNIVEALDEISTFSPFAGHSD